MVLIGIDEVGRGCLWGPVYACALSIPQKVKEEMNNVMELIRDSKKISSKKRKHIVNLLKDHVCYGIGIADNLEIDQYNIREATMIAMHRAIKSYEDQYGLDNVLLLVDGNYFSSYSDNVPYETVIGGDDKHKEISLASIFAKEARDDFVREQIIIRPELKKYGIDTNMGYGSKKHCITLEQIGFDPEEHRRTFKRVLEIPLPNPCLCEK